MLLILFLFLSVYESYKLNDPTQKKASLKATVPKLNYYGGPVISNVKVVTIWWGGSTNVKYSDKLPQFYSGVTNSSWFKVFSEYTTQTQTIGMGSWVKSFDDVYAPTGALRDAQVQSRLVTLINNGSVPKGSNDYYYAIHFAPGISIDDSCVTFCAYHGTISLNGSYVYYGVMPDLGTGGCVTGCGSDPSAFNNLCSVSSHELAETVTDPGVGLATTYSSPLAWYDPNNGENGDICNAQQGKTLGSNGINYTVQATFSNKANKCLVNAVTTPTTTTTTKTTTTKSTSTTTTSTPTCVHSKCIVGTKLDPKCDACVAKIIKADSYCGQVSWDSICVGEVKSVCGQTC
jgi:hypothetical protein